MKTLIKLIFIIAVSSSVLSQSSWEPLYVNHNQYIKDVKFLDPNIGYISLARTPNGDWPRVLKTTDKGSNWTQIWCENYDFFPAIDFINESVGFVYVGNAVKKTIDGGNSWTTKLTTSQNCEWPKIKFVNSQTGYALFNKGWNPSGLTIYKSTNNGESWFVPDPSYNNFNNNVYYTRESDIDFSSFDNNEICITGYTYSPGGWGSDVLKSNDGLISSYNNQEHLTSSPNSPSLSYVRFIYDQNNPNDNWRFAGERGIYKYYNQFYATLISPDWFNAQYGLSFTNYNLGFCAGTGGIYITTNSGYNWTNEYSNGSILTESRMQSFGEVCYIGGANGNFLFRKIPMSLHTNCDWQWDVFNGHIIVDGETYGTPGLNIPLRGGTANLSIPENERYIIENNDTTKQFYYWGNSINQSMNYQNAGQYFIYSGGNINADYKSKLNTNTATALKSRHSLKH